MPAYIINILIPPYLGIFILKSQLLLDLLDKAEPQPEPEHEAEKRRQSAMPSRSRYYYYQFIIIINVALLVPSIYHLCLAQPFNPSLSFFSPPLYNPQTPSNFTPFLCHFYLPSSHYSSFFILPTSHSLSTFNGPVVANLEHQTFSNHPSLITNKLQSRWRKQG